MADKQPMQADGDGAGSAVDGIANAPAKSGGTGESDGAAYPNPHSGKPDPGFDGGQTEKAYHGGPNPNATTED
jgi:hypothetical protein